MRYYIQKEAIFKSEKLINAIEKVKLLVGENTSFEEIYRLLYDCQNEMIALGNYLEAYADFEVCITYLEQACELVYQCTIKDNYIQELNEIIQIIKEVKQTIISAKTDKILIYFLPYKASMWDCFSSIYEEAKKDSRCEIVVMPIPYYEKGSGRKICEYDKFSSQISLMHYENVILENVHPDIIYIQNPYDGTNKVTGVAEDYYTSKLKKYTSLLVYVPYYLSAMYKNEWRMMEKALLPGNINSDLVVLQSEKQKEIYVKNGAFPEKYIVAGSPKADAVINIHKCNIDEIRYRLGIKSSKVIMLNTSITYFLYKNNINEILTCLLGLIENTDITLLWRPHPLLQATIEAINKETLTEYNSIIEKAEKTGKIYVDRSADPLDAIIVSDALISDYSSILIQYYLTGKPVYSLDGNKTYRDTGIVIFDYYDAYLKSEGITLNDFVNMVLSGDDNRRNLRNERLKSYPELIDGKAGKRIHESVINTLLDIKKKGMVKQNYES